MVSGWVKISDCNKTAIVQQQIPRAWASYFASYTYLLRGISDIVINIFHSSSHIFLLRSIYRRYGTPSSMRKMNIAMVRASLLSKQDSLRGNVRRRSECGKEKEEKQEKDADNRQQKLWIHAYSPLIFNYFFPKFLKRCRRFTVPMKKYYADEASERNEFPSSATAESSQMICGPDPRIPMTAEVVPLPPPTRRVAVQGVRIRIRPRIRERPSVCEPEKRRKR